MFRSAFCAVFALSLVTACSNETATIEPAEIKEPEAPVTVQVDDAFSYANVNEVRVSHAHFELVADFDAKKMRGAVSLDLEYVADDVANIILDTDDLTIERVEQFDGAAWNETPFTLGEDDPLLGTPMSVALKGEPEKIRISYETSPGAEGLQWLSPEQTAGKQHPFLFSQFQTIYTRSFAPLQDTPAIRMTYTARIQTPPELIAVMSAAQDPDGVRDGDYSFDMPQAIPPYLVALAIGDVEFKAINDHIGVYAEEYILDASAEEFADTPLMEEAINALYGPYIWGRYDLIVLPPSFPFGGMENPRLSFITPTIIAGDKSLTSLVAHELAHSWSGNLVTNSTWRDAWLNEGFTTYVEDRVMEALYGEERSLMERALAYESLKKTVANAERPELTALKMPADLESPEQAFSQVSYAGGMFFLNFLENRFGRDVFDDFLRKYFGAYAFQSLSTEEFLIFFKENLWSEYPDAVSEEEIIEWIYEPGLPSTLIVPQSDAFARVDALRTEWAAGNIAVGDIMSDDWTTHEWLHFVNNLSDDLGEEQFAALDEAFALTGAQNAEIAFAWYMKAIARDYEPAFAPLEAFLLQVGRGKFIYRLYQALIDHDRQVWAQGIYDEARPGYHPIAQSRIDRIFEEAGAPSKD